MDSLIKKGGREVIERRVCPSVCLSVCLVFSNEFFLGWFRSVLVLYGMSVLLDNYLRE